MKINSKNYGIMPLRERIINLKKSISKLEKLRGYNKIIQEQEKQLKELQKSK